MTEAQKPVKMTKSLMNQYKDSLISRGCKQQTISMYFCYLNRLYAFLPGEKEVTNDAAKNWVESLKNKGYSDRTINLHISAVNGFLRFCGHPSVPVSVISVPRNEDLPDLSRDEYLTILSYAKKNYPERDYLLVKALATIDMGIADLCFLTVEACRKGVMELPNNKETVIPENLNQELLTFINRNEMKSGPIFVSRNGQVLDRSNITHMIRKMGNNAGVDERKCNPRALHRLYQHTQEEINKELMSVRQQAYNNLLNSEQETGDVLKVG